MKKQPGKAAALPLPPRRAQTLVQIGAAPDVQPLQNRVNRLQFILQRAQIVEGNWICRSPGGCICSEQPLQSPGKAALSGSLRGGVLGITVQGSGQNFRDGANDGSVSRAGAPSPRRRQKDSNCYRPGRCGPHR